MITTLIIADDSETIQRIIRKNLIDLPLEMKIASTEQDLLRLVEEIPRSLVLMDFCLSDKMNGHLLVEKVKGVAPSTKIVVMFGTFDPIDENTLKKVGARDHIVKPFDSSHFRNLVESLMGQEEEEELTEAPLREMKKEDFSPPEISAAEEEDFDLWEAEGPAATQQEMESWDVRLPDDEEQEPLKLQEQEQEEQEQEEEISPSSHPFSKNNDLWGPDEIVLEAPEETETVKIHEEIQEEAQEEIPAELQGEMEEEVQEKERALLKEEMSSLSEKILREVIWEVVPQLAEKMLKEELAKIKEKS